MHDCGREFIIICGGYHLIKNRLRYMQPNLESSGGKTGKVHTSPWLANFLEKSRESTVPIAPDICAADDTYLRIFSKQFAPTSSITVSDRITEPGVDDTGVDAPHVERSDGCSYDEGFENDDDICIVSDRVTDDGSQQIKSSGKIRLFNLPYSATEKEVFIIYKRIHVLFTRPM
jgi:hypothetical protein